MSFRAKLLIVFGGIYVAQVVAYNWGGVDYLPILALSPDRPTFRWWQVFTFWLTMLPKFTVGYVYDMWVIYFCVETVVAALGRFSFFVLFVGASLFSISTWWLCSSLFDFMHVSALGFSASIFALLTIFCWTDRTATFQVMWLPIHVRGVHILYFSIFKSVVAFLARENTLFGLDMGGLVFAGIYITRGERFFLGTAHWLLTAPRKASLYWRQRRHGIRLVKTNSNSDSTK